jgi:predicted DNA-binding helix-hairpin-helix protein
MEALEKLRLVCQSAAFEDPEAGRQADLPCSSDNLPVFNAVVSGGKHIRLLKSLLTSVCENNCGYCGIRWGKDSRRVTFQPDEMAELFLRMYRSRACEGLFLSSGIAGGGIRTQDRLIATAEILRRRGYRGYLHLKVMPGAERDQVARAMQLADRVSINLEAPDAPHLAAIAPRKDAGKLFEPLVWMETIRRTNSPATAWNGRWPSSSTQFVVGAAGETDRDLLGMAKRLRVEAGLARIHYSTFTPEEGTPLAALPAESPARTFRLYQADFLIRDYGFQPEEMLPDGDWLARDVDPKLGYARRRLADSPVEVNRASREELLRVPGVGPRTARAILDARRGGARIRSLEDLRHLGAQTGRMEPFILINGHSPVRQMRLF